MSKVGRPTFMKVGCPTLPKQDVLLWTYWTSNFGHVAWTLLLEICVIGVVFVQQSKVLELWEGDVEHSSMESLDQKVE